MNKVERAADYYWDYYQAEGEVKIDNCGKWMHSFEDIIHARSICEKAIKEGIVLSCKNTSSVILEERGTGVICFYIDGFDKKAHRRVLSFMIENNLIKLTANGKLYNIGFKFDAQTRNMEYRSDFTALIKLSDYVNLTTKKLII